MARRREADWTQRQAERREEDADRQFARQLRRNLGSPARTLFIGLIALLLCVDVYYRMNPVAPHIDIPEADLNPIGKQVAWSTVEQWLGDGQLGGEARVVSWDGGDAAPVGDGQDRETAIVHVFAVSTDQGWWRVEQTVRADGLTPLGSPAVEPIPMDEAATPDSTPAWDGELGTLQATETLDRLADQWARALMGGDDDALTVLMNDDPRATYTALHLGDVDSTSVERLAYLDKGRVNRNKGTSDRAAMRVSVSLKPVAQDAQGARFTYDLLVADPDGTPRVLAWGAPGTGGTLAEHANRSGMRED